MNESAIDRTMNFALWTMIIACFVYYLLLVTKFYGRYQATQQSSSEMESSVYAPPVPVGEIQTHGVGQSEIELAQETQVQREAAQPTGYSIEE